MMWICPICETTNDTHICTSCGFDASRDYINSRSICPLPKSASKIFHPELSGDNILMASNDINYVFGRKMDRKQITAIYFRSKKENIGEDAWDVSEKQNGSIMAWTEEKRDGFKDLYLAANGNILANKDCSSLFKEYRNLKKFVGLQYFRTDQTENMSYMFYDCESLASLDVSYFATSQVTNMSDMFFGCESLASLDVSHFATSQVTNMSDMFSFCKRLASLDVSHFATSQVTNMSCMFYDCESLASLDVSHFDTSQVKDMREMFSACKSLASLDVSHFDTSQVEDLSVPLSEYLAVPQGVCLKKRKENERKENGFFRKLWEKLNN